MLRATNISTRSWNKRQLPLQARQGSGMPLSPKSKKAKKDAVQKIQQEAFMALKQIRDDNDGTAIRGDLDMIVERYHNIGFGSDFVSKRMLRYRLGIEKAGKPAFNDKIPLRNINMNGKEDISSVTGDSSNIAKEINQKECENNKGGRPKGSTQKSKDDNVQHVENCIELATNEYYATRKLYDDQGKRVPKGTFKSILNKIATTNNIDPSLIKLKTVISRIDRKNHTGTRDHMTSPIKDLEPIIYQWCEKLADIGQPLHKRQVIGLAEEMISGTDYENKMLEFKRKRGSSGGNLLGAKWYRNFMHRFRHQLKRSRCLHKDVKRHTWCTEDHFRNMYEAVYTKMVEAKVAEKLESEVMFNKEGKEVENEAEMYGRPTKYRLTNPDNIVFVDETGCNTNQKTDGHVGGRLYVLPRGCSEGGTVGASSDIHFTVMCFTSGSGKPIMCAIILKSNKDSTQLPINWRFGIDIRKDLIDGSSEVEIFEKNCKEGQAMEGGPTCFFNGEKIPCFVGSSPKASITSDLLKKMLEKLDSKNIFDRSNGMMPFLLLDGHHSRLQLPFLQYICNEKHKWMVCIGVPYGTHLWQVHDASSMNGNFKIQLNKSKSKYLEYRSGDLKFLMTDVVPLVKMAWKDSFANQDRARDAISSRGWGPLNYVLLDHPKLVINDCDTDSKAELNESGPIVSNYLNKLIDKTLKNKAANKKWEESKKKAHDKENVFKRISAVTSLTSGSMAACNEYCLTSETILEAATVREKEQKAKEIESRAKKEAIVAKQNNAFEVVIKKYMNKDQKLLTNDYKVLLRHVQKKNDSPIRKRYKDLHEQFLVREHRLKELPMYHLASNINNVHGDFPTTKTDSNINEFNRHSILSERSISTITASNHATTNDSSSNTSTIVTNIDLNDVAAAMCDLSGITNIASI